MKKIKKLQFILGLNVVLGIVLLAGGIITGKHGASVIGLIIAAVNVQQWIQWNKKDNQP
jgi:hypothetical protein